MKKFRRNQGEYKITLDGKEVGAFKLNQLKVVRQPTICDYLKSGLQIDFTVAIDFSIDNIDSFSPQSLHYRNGESLNQYESVLYKFGSVLCHYNNENKYSIYGFAGTVNGETSQNFPLTFNKKDPTVFSFQGLMNTYRRSLKKVQLAHPRCFSEIINQARIKANQKFHALHRYGVLLLITCGEMSDADETLKELNEARKNGIHVYIVGVGNAQFPKLEKICRGENPNNEEKKEEELAATSGAARRKLAAKQAVEEEKKGDEKGIRNNITFLNYKSCETDELFKIEVTKILAELPNEITSYCKQNNFTPDMQS